jgi:hypothetical protein
MMKKYVIAVVCALLAGNVHAVEIIKEYGNWLVVMDKKTGDTAAGVVNNAKDMLTYRCVAELEKCFFRLAPNLKCEAGNEYPILANTGEGAVAIRGVCAIGAETEAGNYIDLAPVDEVFKLVKQGSVIGFAIAMDSGKFKVVRFSLNGSTKSLAFAEAALMELKDSTIL